MTATVTLDVFSGLPNPSWTLSTSQYADLQSRVAPLRAGVFETGFEPAEWGYKGLIVSAPNAPTVRIIAGVEAKAAYLQFEGRSSTLIDPTRQIEQWLLQTSGGLVESLGLEFAELTRARNESHIKNLPAGETLGGFRCETGVAYPGYASRSNWYASSSNCYNYANNVMATGGVPAVPGPNNAASWTVAEMIDAATNNDRLTLVAGGGPLPAACPRDPKSHYLVICLREDFGNGSFTDFHCLRLDNDGRWSHKDGSSAVSRRDGARQEMTDLRSARFKIPMAFVGFFESTDGVRRIS